MRPPRLSAPNATPRNKQYTEEQTQRTLRSISFGSTTSNADADRNMDAWKATGTSPGAANTEFAVTHNLQRVPIGFFTISTSAAAHFYKSTTAWTAATNSSLGSIFVKCDQANVAFVMVLL